MSQIRTNKAQFFYVKLDHLTEDTLISLASQKFPAEKTSKVNNSRWVVLEFDDSHCDFYSMRNVGLSCPN